MHIVYKLTGKYGKSAMLMLHCYPLELKPQTDIAMRRQGHLTFQTPGMPQAQYVLTA